MTVQRNLFRFVLIITTMASPGVGAEELTAVLVFAETGQKPTGSVDACTAERELKFMVVQKPKINGKENLLAFGAEIIPSADIRQKEYEKYPKQRLRDVRKIAWRKEILVSSATFDPGVPVSPVAPEGINFQKNTPRQLRSMYDVTLEAEVPRTKQRVSYPLRSIAGVYLQPASAPVDEALFAHAREQGDYGTWMSLLNRPGSFKVKEAESEVVRSVQGCVNGALAEFEKGNFGIIETARKLANNVKSMAPGSAEANDFTGKLEKARKAVEDQIAEGDKFAKEQQWDTALQAWTPVAKYVKETNQEQLASFLTSYRGALQGSHDVHRAKGDSLTGDNKLKEAIVEYEVALLRVPASAEAAKGKKEARILLALVESGNLRERDEPRRAKILLESIMGESGFREDPRLQQALGDCKCHLADQLHAAALPRVQTRRDVTPPPPVVIAAAQKKGPATRALVRPAPQTPAPTVPRIATEMLPVNTPEQRDAYLGARNELQEAVGLCSKEEPKKLLDQVHAQLALYHQGQAQKALGQVPIRSATALAHLNTANYYVPGVALQNLMNQASQHLQEKAEVLVGVTFDDASPNRGCGGYARELGDFAARSLGESAAGSRIRLVDGAALLRGGANQRSEKQWMVISGQVTRCEVTRGRDYGQVKVVRSEYWADQAKTVKQPYNYREAEYSLQASLEVTYRAVSSAGQTAGQQGAGGRDGYSCKAVSDVHPNDAHNWLTKPKNNECRDIPDAGSLMRKPMRDAQAQLATAMRSYGSETSRVFYDLASQASDEHQKREHALTFLFGGGANLSSERVSARTLATAIDKDLQTGLK